MCHLSVIWGFLVISYGTRMGASFRVSESSLNDHQLKLVGCAPVKALDQHGGSPCPSKPRLGSRR